MTTRRNLCFIVLCYAAGLMACGDPGEQDWTADEGLIPAPIHIQVQVVNHFPHDTAAYTEGFSFYQGKLYESTGAPDYPTHNGTWIAEIDLSTGTYDRKVDLGNTVFGEGVSFMNGRAYQLTYKTKKGFVYDAATFRKLREFSYGSEGWGLTNDGTHLIMSTGSSNLYYLHPDSLNFVRTLAVQDHNGYVNNLNELEFIGGYIYANQWLTPYILQIDPATGYVTGRFDLSKLTSEIKAKYPGAEELNGIAHDTETGKTYITGKKWPYIYEIKW